MPSIKKTAKTTIAGRRQWAEKLARDSEKFLAQGNTITELEYAPDRALAANEYSAIVHRYDEKRALGGQHMQRANQRKHRIAQARRQKEAEQIQEAA